MVRRLVSSQLQAQVKIDHSSFPLVFYTRNYNHSSSKALAQTLITFVNALFTLASIRFSRIGAHSYEQEKTLFVLPCFLPLRPDLAKLLHRFGGVVDCMERLALWVEHIPPLHP